MSDGVESAQLGQMRVSFDDGVVVVTLTGEVDLVNAAEMRSGLQEQLDARPGCLVVELALDFLGSTGLSMLIEVQRTAERAGIAFAVVATTRAALRPFELSGLTVVVPLFGSVPEAVKSLRQKD